MRLEAYTNPKLYIDIPYKTTSIRVSLILTKTKLNTFDTCFMGTTRDDSIVKFSGNLISLLNILYFETEQDYFFNIGAFTQEYLNDILFTIKNQKSAIFQKSLASPAPTANEYEHEI